ncbi:MAG: Rv3235 family protein [Micropruina glycogenica]
MNSAIRPTRAPMVLAPAVRLVEPVLLEPVQAPLLPWPTSVEQVAESVDIAPRVQRIVSQLTNAVIEVLCGRRALVHLEAHLRAPVYDLVGHLRGARLLPALSLASLHLQQPADHVIEAAARLRDDHRSVAAALCFTRSDGRWRMCALELALDPAVVLRSS